MRHTNIDYKKRVCRAMNFISENIEKDLPLEKIAHSASFSMFHFHRIFKTVVGETVAGFTRRLRLELAANRLISQPIDDITRIAISCGFSSSQNFSKAFKQNFEMTPSEYRKSKIGNKDSKNRKVLSLQATYNLDPLLMKLPENKRSNKMKAEIKEMPEYNLGYIRKLGAYCKETCEPAFAELLQWAAPRNYAKPGNIIAIYWDNPDVTSSEKCRFDACVVIPKGTIPEGNIHTQTISAGDYAVCSFEVEIDKIQQAWEDAFRWVCNSGYECDDKPCYELYHNDAAEDPNNIFIFDICIPLKHKN